MSNNPPYPYITKDNLDNRQNYMYSKYGGTEFLKIFFENREEAKQELIKSAAAAAEFNINEICLPDVLQQLYQLQRIPVVKEMYEAWQQPDKRLSEKLLDQLTHAFEVRKRIHADYDLQAKPVNAEEYKETSSYVAFSTILIDVLANTNTQGINMRYLNVLLKLMDTILSFKERLNPIEAKCVLYALEVEGSIVIQLMTDKGLRV